MLLKMAANMLLDATHFPATFDRYLEIIFELARSNEDDVLEDLAEMLLTWGINNSRLRYTVVRTCDYLCKLPIENVFVCVCVCLFVPLFVSLSRLRSRELDVVAPRFFHRREELRLASCTN